MIQWSLSKWSHLLIFITFLSTQEAVSLCRPYLTMPRLYENSKHLTLQNLGERLFQGKLIFVELQNFLPLLWPVVLLRIIFWEAVSMNIHAIFSWQLNKTALNSSLHLLSMERNINLLMVQWPCRCSLETGASVEHIRLKQRSLEGWRSMRG